MDFGAVSIFWAFSDPLLPFHFSAVSFFRYVLSVIASLDALAFLAPTYASVSSVHVSLATIWFGFCWIDCCCCLVFLSSLLLTVAIFHSSLFLFPDLLVAAPSRSGVFHG